MHIEDITMTVFAACNGIRLVAYVPQIYKAFTHRNGASAISGTTWGLFFVANVSTVRVRDRQSLRLLVGSLLRLERRMLRGDFARSLLGRPPLARLLGAARSAFEQVSPLAHRVGPDIDSTGPLSKGKRTIPSVWRSARSWSVVDLPHGARSGLQHHRGTAKQ
jgi:hypothetical protein